MKLSGFLAFTWLSISILSFGLTDAVNAQSALPLSVNTDSSSYTTGNSIAISGTIKTLAEYPQDVIIIVSNPIGNFVNVNQVQHDAEGNYSITFTAGGPYMTSSGEYSIQASYGAQKITGTFDFISSDSTPTPAPVLTEPVPEPAPEPEPEPEPECECKCNCCWCFSECNHPENECLCVCICIDSCGCGCDTTGECGCCECWGTLSFQ